MPLARMMLSMSQRCSSKRRTRGSPRVSGTGCGGLMTDMAVSFDMIGNPAGAHTLSQAQGTGGRIARSMRPYARPACRIGEAAVTCFLLGVGCGDSFFDGMPGRRFLDHQTSCARQRE